MSSSCDYESKLNDLYSKVTHKSYGITIAAANELSFHKAGFWGLKQLQALIGDNLCVVKPNDSNKTVLAQEIKC